MRTSIGETGELQEGVSEDKRRATGGEVMRAGTRSRVSGKGRSKVRGEGPGLITRVAGGTKRGSNGPGI